MTMGLYKPHTHTHTHTHMCVASFLKAGSQYDPIDECYVDAGIEFKFIPT